MIFLDIYPDISTVNATNDVTQILVYANTITNGWFGISTLLAFFLVMLIGSIFMQMRFSGRERFEVSFAVASFTTFGLSILMSLENGLLSPDWVYITISLSLISVIWLYFGSQN